MLDTETDGGKTILDTEQRFFFQLNYETVSVV